MGKPKGGQHFIPRFYLRSFAYEVKDKKAFVWQHEANTEPKKLYVGDIAKRTHIYSTRKGMDGERDVANELRLGEKETLMAPVFRHVIEQEGVRGLSGDDLVLFGTFFLMMSLRTPNNFALADRMFRDAVISDVQDIAKDSEEMKKVFETVRAENPGVYEDWTIEQAQAVIAEGTDRENIRLSHSAGIRDMWASLRQALPFVMQMRWGFLIPHDGVSERFFTSDDPVVATVNDGEGCMLIRGGWGQPSIEVIFPLSPTLCFVASHKGLNGTATTDAESIRSINHFLVLQSEKFIYASTQNADTQESMRERDNLRGPHTEPFQLAKVYE
jgi:hypothetical protein